MDLSENISALNAALPNLVGFVWVVCVLSVLAIATWLLGLYFRTLHPKFTGATNAPAAAATQAQAPAQPTNAEIAAMAAAAYLEMKAPGQHFKVTDITKT